MPTRFLAGDRYRMEPVRNAKVFQSTPTSFLAGDFPADAFHRIPRCFNPRRPVSWPATAGWL